MTRLWCNGQWLDPLDFQSSPMDRGAIHGLGLFETMLAFDGVLVFADRHLARLRQGHEALGWTVDLPGFQEIACELLSKNRLAKGRARIRLTVTAGSGPIHDLTPGDDRLVWMTAFPALIWQAPMLSAAVSLPAARPSTGHFWIVIILICMSLEILFIR